jgi:hypothetical protein
VDVSFLEGTAKDLDDAAQRIAALQAENEKLTQREHKRDPDRRRSERATQAES